MLDELFSFQKRAVSAVLEKIKLANAYYPVAKRPQIVSFTAPTGSGKTIMAATVIENILYGCETFPAQPDSILRCSEHLTGKPDPGNPGAEQCRQRGNRHRYGSL